MIPLFKVFMPDTVDQPLLETLHSGYITQGSKVEEFERVFSEAVDNPYTVTVNSGTSALTLALRLSDVGIGSEVITTPMTCSATNLPILALGATPVFADIDPKTGLIDPESVERLITDKTKAVMCVDWGGMPCQLDNLLKVSHSHSVKLVEDSAHSMGAEYKDRKVGSIADFTCFSLQAIKHITTADGGVLTCSNKEDYERAKRLRWFGIKRDPDSKDTRINEDIIEWGYKFHMNDLTATIGIEQMKYLKFVVGAYRANAMYYNRQLDDTVYGKPIQSGSSYWLYTVTLPNKVARDKFKDYMIANKIQVSEVHRRNDDYAVFKPFKKQQLPGVDAFSRTMVAIPVHWGLTARELTHITRTMNNFAREFRQWF